MERRVARLFVSEAIAKQTVPLSTLPFVNGKAERDLSLRIAERFSSFIDAWVAPKACRSRYLQERNHWPKRPSFPGSLELQGAKDNDA